MLFSLVALTVLLLAANAAFVGFVERRVETTLENRLGSPVSVEMSGWPVGPRLLTGSLPEANVRVQDLDAPVVGLDLGRLDLTLEEVEYTGERDGPLDAPIEASDARFESRLTENEVSGLARMAPGVSGVEISGEELRLELPAGATADAELAAEDGGLLLKPDTPLLDPEIPLIPERLPGGASIRDARVEEGGVLIEGAAGDLGVEAADES